MTFTEIKEYIKGLETQVDLSEKLNKKLKKIIAFLKERNTLLEKHNNILKETYELMKNNRAGDKTIIENNEKTEKILLQRIDNLSDIEPFRKYPKSLYKRIDEILNVEKCKQCYAVAKAGKEFKVHKDKYDSLERSWRANKKKVNQFPKR